MKKDDRNIKFLLEIALNEYLSPKKCIFEYGLSKNNFIKMMNEIKLSFFHIRSGSMGNGDPQLMTEQHLLFSFFFLEKFKTWTRSVGQVPQLATF